MRPVPQIFETFEDPSYSVFAKWLSISMMLLIVLATTCFVLETEAQLESGVLYGTSANVRRLSASLWGNLPMRRAMHPALRHRFDLRFCVCDAQDVFKACEYIASIAFTIEYVVRLLCCPLEPNGIGLIKFIIDIPNIIDLLAVVPFWIGLFTSSNSGLGFVRVIRLIRIFRVFKFGKYSTGLQMFTGSIAKSTQPLSVLLFMLVLSVIILSSVMFLFEGNIANSNSTSYDEELLLITGVSDLTHLNCFGTIPRSFWWAIITMTTVGYGDCYPITTPGKMLAMTTTILGVLIIALPITVLGSNFAKMVEMYEEESGMVREFDKNEDGMMDEQELREFLFAKRKDNALRKDVDLNPVRLMAKYDPQGNGTLSFNEFQNLKRDIIDPAAADPQANVRILLKRSAEQDVKIAAMQESLDRIERMLGGTPPAAAAATAAAAQDAPQSPRGGAL